MTHPLPPPSPPSHSHPETSNSTHATLLLKLTCDTQTHQHNTQAEATGTCPETQEALAYSAYAAVDTGLYTSYINAANDEEDGPYTTYVCAQKRDEEKDDDSVHFIPPLADGACQLAREELLQMKALPADEIGNPWMRQYILAMALPNGPARRHAVASFYSNFCTTAARLGATILEDLLRPSGEQKLPKAGLGGVAGGTKFILEGIVFKLATDPIIDKKNRRYLYGNTAPDEALAGKSAANEMRGYNAYFEYFFRNSIPVQPPPAILLSSGGFRLLAMPELPLKGATFVYGSADGGDTVHAANPAFNTVMQAAAERLHLAPHLVKDRQLCAAGDVEGHVGSDGRLYLIDLGRAFPPEDPNQTKGTLQSSASTMFYRQLRPELLQRCKAAGLPAVSSDSFTEWGRQDGAFHNRNAAAATKHLLDDALVALVKELEMQYVADHIDLEQAVAPWLKLNPLLKDGMAIFLARWQPKSNLPFFDGVGFGTALRSEVFEMWRNVKFEGTNPQSLPVPATMNRFWNTFTANLDLGVSCHRHGVPLRLLGLLRSRLSLPILQQLCVVEMARRSLKNLLRFKLRECQTSNGNFKDLAAGFLDSVVACSADLDPLFWGTELWQAILSRFGPKALEAVDVQAMCSLLEPRKHEVVCYVLSRAGLHELSSAQLGEVPVRPETIAVEVHCKSMTYFDVVRAESYMDIAAAETDMLRTLAVVADARAVCKQLLRTEPSRQDVAEMEGHCARIQVICSEHNGTTSSQDAVRAEAFASYAQQRANMAPEHHPPWLRVCDRLCRELSQDSLHALLIPVARNGADPAAIRRLLEFGMEINYADPQQVTRVGGVTRLCVCVFACAWVCGVA